MLAAQHAAVRGEMGRLARQEAALRRLLAEHRAAEARAAAEERELAEAVEVRRGAHDEAQARLGEARARHEEARRAAELAADQAAAGDGAAAQGLGALAGDAAAALALVQAHERRAAALAAELEAAAEALAAHRAAAVDREGKALEALLVELAGATDTKLDEAVELFGVTLGVFDRRRELRPKEPWPPPFEWPSRAGARWEAWTDAVARASWPLNPQAAFWGSNRHKPLAELARTARDCWSQGRGEPIPPPTSTKVA